MKQAISWMLVLCLVFSSGCSLFSGKNADQADADKELDEVEVKRPPPMWKGCSGRLV
jgi:Ca-activated chloride channel homolog